MRHGPPHLQRHLHVHPVDALQVLSVTLTHATPSPLLPHRRFTDTHTSSTDTSKYTPSPLRQRSTGLPQIPTLVSQLHPTVSQRRHSQTPWKAFPSLLCTAQAQHCHLQHSHTPGAHTVPPDPAHVGSHTPRPCAHTHTHTEPCPHPDTTHAQACPPPPCATAPSPQTGSQPDLTDLAETPRQTRERGSSQAQQTQTKTQTPQLHFFDLSFQAAFRLSS